MSEQFSQTQQQVTLVGVGNWRMSTDDIALNVLALAKGRYTDNVELLSLGTDALALLDIFRRQAMVVIVDTVTGQGASGDVLVWEPDLKAPPCPGSSIHQIGPVEVLTVAKLLYPERMPTRLLFVLINTDELATNACVDPLDSHSAVNLEHQVLLTIDDIMQPWRAYDTCMHGADP